MKWMFWAAALFTPFICCGQKITYSRSFPGSTPAYFRIDLDKTGALEYRESPTDDQPLKAQLPDSDTSQLFEMTEKLGYFKSPLESGLKVANTGKKTFTYQEGSGPATAVSFHYSRNETAQQLQEKFEEIGESERAYLGLDQTVRYDHLGINDALAEVEELWLRKQLAAPKQFIPLLTKITSHESLMHLVRDRAARLKDEFEAAPVSSADPKQK